MLDLALLAVLGLLFARGWLRGLIREAVSLAVIVVGSFLALRLNGAVGGIIESMLSVSENVARIGAGIAIFLVISIGASVAIRVLQLGVRLLPGVTTLNRVGGGLFSAGAGFIVITLILSAVAAVNPSESVKEQIEGSAIASFITNEDGIPQGALGVLAGDRILSTTIRLQDLFGEPNVLATTATVSIPQTAEDDIIVNNRAADRIADRTNRVRVRGDAEPLARAPKVDQVALERAAFIATSGQFSTTGPGSTTTQDRIDDADLRFENAIEIVALGATAASINDAIEADERASALLLDGHRRIGVGVVRSVNGLVAVVIFTS